MRQFARCGYCDCVLSDAFHVDHMDENCLNDAWVNLVACCGTCHADKTMHRRKGRLDALNGMLLRASTCKLGFASRWSELDNHWKALPEWLRCRLDEHEAILHSAACRHSDANPFQQYCRR